MVTCNVQIIEVMGLKPKHAKQIRCLTSYNSCTSDLELLRAIHRQLSAKELKPIGWVLGKHLENAPDGTTMWLVQLADGRLFFVSGPDKGAKDISQLFV